MNNTKHPSNRQLKVGQQIRFLVSIFFLKEDFIFDNFDSKNLTIVDVVLSPDLKNANIFVTTNSVFENELSGGNSDFKDVIWSRIESLEVVDVFCTASECATTFTSNFSTISIFIIFHFFVFGFSHFDMRNFGEEFFRMNS